MYIDHNVFQSIGFTEQGFNNTNTMPREARRLTVRERVNGPEMA